MESEGMLKVQEIREIVEMIEGSSIQRFEFSQADTKLVIVKQEANATASSVVTSTPAAGQESKKSLLQVKPENEPVQNIQAPGDMFKITSPIVGTFYAAPDPEAEPFIKPGQEVEADTVVCIIEVMKLFNEVHAGVTGQIAEVLVKDGDFVEYGQPLFLVKRA
jgi:acetyl-CoA carboxylase biotin carboxyl carrier protein